MKDWSPAGLLNLAGAAEGPVAPWYLYISGVRLIVMDILTAGCFEAYWMYRNLCYVRDRDLRPIRPFWRTVFALFYIHDLLGAIRDDPLLRSAGQASFPARWLARYGSCSRLAEVSSGSTTIRRRSSPWTWGQRVLFAIGLVLYLAPLMMAWLLRALGANGPTS